MKITQYTAVNFEVQEGQNGDIQLQFTVLLQLGPDAFLPSEVMRIPFSAESWSNFQRHVESNGNVPSIAVSKVMPTLEGI